MNILFSTPSFHPHKGGAESVIADLAAEYVKRGHRVSVVTSRAIDSLAAQETHNGIEIFRLNYPSTKISGLQDLVSVVVRSGVLLTRLRGLIKYRQIETVCVGLVGIDSFFILLLQWLIGFKLIVYIHGGELRSYIKVSRLMRSTLKRCLRSAFAVVAVSEELKRETIAFAPGSESKISVIPNGVPIAEIAATEPFVHPRKYILFVGRLHPVKGVDVVITAFQHAAKTFNEFDLIVAGSGPLEASLQALAQAGPHNANIIFLGDQERSEVFALMQGCEFLVLPSYAEGCPLTLLEALAAGKKVLASDVKGNRDIIRPGVNGVLFEAGNSPALAELLGRFANNVVERPPPEKNAREFDLGDYDLSRIADQHLQVYAGIREQPRVCLISAFYYHDENCAGLSSYYFNLAESLVARGLDVCLITPEGSNSLPRQSKVRLLTTRSSLSQWSRNGFGRVASRLRFSIDAYRKLRQLERNAGFDVVIAPELFAPALVIGLFNRRKLFTRIHTPTYLGDKFNQRSQLIGRTLSLLEKSQARRSGGLSVASKTLATVISRDWRIPSHKIEVIPNSVQIDWVRQLAAGQPREIAGDYLLYFGRLEKRKGVHILAQALPAVFRKHPTLKMVFAGRDTGLQEEILRDNDRERIVFFDTLPKERLFGLVRYAKLVVLPSLFENMSNAGLEAMALARPVIGTHQTSFAEIIEDNQDGFLVEPGNAAALAAKILWCLDYGDLDEVGERAYRKVQRYDSNRVASQNIDFYLRHLKNQR